MINLTAVCIISCHGAIGNQFTFHVRGLGSNSCHLKLFFLFLVLLFCFVLLFCKPYFHFLTDLKLIYRQSNNNYYSTGISILLLQVHYELSFLKYSNLLIIHKLALGTLRFSKRQSDKTKNLQAQAYRSMGWLRPCRLLLRMCRKCVASFCLDLY